MKTDFVYILDKLIEAGYEAYIVGGCVRDICLGHEPHDFDITTNALPEQVTEVFADKKVILTGLKHGTVTVMHNGEPFEVTTFRIDGEYSDNRRPDSVEFTSSLTDDLSRRDFTMNAMAMDRKALLYDYYDGTTDIEDGIIRCVGEPDKRFTEDALRILRAVRFASVLGFDIEEKTAESALALKERLDFVSAERIRTELVKTICGENVVNVLLKYREIIGQIIPEMRSCFDFDQHSQYHRYNVYEHTVRAVGNIPADSPDCEILRIALFFHDIGKPRTFRLDRNGRGHFKGHARVSADMARKIMKRLAFDNKTTDIVCTVIAHHSDKFDDGLSEYDIKRMICEIGADNFFLTARAKHADNSAKQNFVLEENTDIESYVKTAHMLIDKNCCMSLAQLEIDGNDLTAIGFSGKTIGMILEILLDMVMRGEIRNEHDILVRYAKEMYR